MQANGLPSRTAILTAAARALGSREPDASVRNPDSLAERLIGPAERRLIDDHPIGRALAGEFEEVIADPDVFGLTWLMLLRTRFIDDVVLRAIRGGATQIVILGAGFDTRAHRLRDALSGVDVYEIDHPSTQEYKRERVDAALGSSRGSVKYLPADFTREGVSDVLARGGVESSRRTYFVCEGVSMYVPEQPMQETLRATAGFAPGSGVMLEYLNRRGLDVLMKYPSGMIKNAIAWGEPFVFGVPDGEDREYFRGCGLELGETLKIGSPESVQRYATHADGTPYGARFAKAIEERRAAALAAMDEEGRRQAAEAFATAGYWLAELHVQG